MDSREDNVVNIGLVQHVLERPVSYLCWGNSLLQMRIYPDVCTEIVSVIYSLKAGIPSVLPTLGMQCRALPGIMARDLQFCLGRNVHDSIQHQVFVFIDFPSPLTQASEKT